MAISIDYSEKCSRIIGKYIDDGKKKFVIYPFGSRGKLARIVLNIKYGIKEYLLFDNAAQTNDDYEVYDIERINEFDVSEAILILANDDQDDYLYSEVRSRAMDYFGFESIVDISSPSYYFDPSVFFENSYFSKGMWNFSRYSLCESCMKEIYYKGIPGQVVECGVLLGDFANVMSRCFPDRRLYLFDTFEGVPENRVTDIEKTMWDIDFLRKSMDYFSVVPEIEQIIDRIAWKKHVVVKKGFFPDTAIGDKEVEDERYCLVDIDMGFYDSTVEALNFFYDRLSPGGYILVDDIRHKGVYSTRRAVDEFCAERRIGYTPIQYGCIGLAVISKAY